MKVFVEMDIPKHLAGRQPIIFFDGDCFLCDHMLKFFLKKNILGDLNFASLQSDAGIEILKLTGSTVPKYDTILLLQENKLYKYSTAIIKIATRLSYPWRLLGILYIIPLFIRDGVYKYISKRRYKWFGRKLICEIETEYKRTRFLS
jgi:predicted DCC family thiol-disulfide oxidoreductase YuxK